MVTLFLLLTILMIIEASTSLSRLTGYLLKTPESGLILQSSLALLSRVVMFLFMPILGYLSDANLLGRDDSSLLSSIFVMPLGLSLLYIYKYRVLDVYSILIKRVNSHGSFFKGTQSFELNGQFQLKKRSLNVLNRFYLLVLIAYIPYYLAWPIVILLLDTYHDNRGMILGMSSVFNGINTIILTLFVDPKLIKIGKYPRILPSVYLNLIKIRIFASFISIVLLLSVYQALLI